MRGAIKRAIRAWFESQGYIEVEPGCLQVSPGNEAHLAAFATTFEPSATPAPLYLHTSPEFAMKKLLAAGETAIYAFAPVFRNGEVGPLHTPEFTMLEWYRTGAPHQQLMDDCVAIARLAAETADNFHWSWRGATCSVRQPPRITSVTDAFARHAGIDLAATLDGVEPNLSAMRAACTTAGVRVAADDTWSDLFSRILAGRIEPRLGVGTLEMLTEYPLVEAALARPLARDPRFAERFEMYVSGVELANGFGELTDAEEQRRRFMAEMDEKERVHGVRYPIDEDFITALASMPPASGCALGFDRLVMLATGAHRVDDVLWTPFPAMARP